MLIEAEKRRDNFDLENSVGVVLADGQTWYLPKPWVVIRPTFVDGVAMNPYRFFSYSAKLDVLLDAIAAAEDLDTVICGAATLAAYVTPAVRPGRRRARRLPRLPYRRSRIDGMDSPGDGRATDARKKSQGHWRRLTLLAQGTLPDAVLLENAEDLAKWMVALGHPVPPSWAEEVLAEIARSTMEGFF